MLRQRLAATASLALFAAAFGGCGPGEPAEPDADLRPPGTLEVGYHDMDTDEFVPFTDDMAVPVVLGANGLNMIVPSLRAVDIDPRGPEPTITIDVGDILMAADIKGEPVDMDDRDDGYVLWDLRVPFLTDLCCYNCFDGVVKAELMDYTGRPFIGQVRIQLSRNGTCPDPTVCCADTNACPDPSTTQVCE